MLMGPNLASASRVQGMENFWYSAVTAQAGSFPASVITSLIIVVTSFSRLSFRGPGNDAAEGQVWTKAGRCLLRLPSEVAQCLGLPASVARHLPR